jgi:hypothetical protein
MSGTRVTGSPRLALEKHWGYKIAQDLFNDKQIVHNTNFHLIWWDGIKAVIDEYPKMYQVWITKHVSFCPTYSAITDTKVPTIRNAVAAMLKMNTPHTLTDAWISDVRRCFAFLFRT